MHLKATFCKLDWLFKIERLYSFDGFVIVEQKVGRLFILLRKNLGEEKKKRMGKSGKSNSDYNCA